MYVWRSKANRGQIQWITYYVLPIWYLVSRWGLGPKVCMHYFGCGMNWIKGYYMIDCEGKKWNPSIFNLFNGNAFLNIVILYYLLMRRDVWFANHLVLLSLFQFSTFLFTIFLLFFSIFPLFPSPTCYATRRSLDEKQFFGFRITSNR